MRGYAAAMTSLVAPGGALVLKTLAEATAASRGARAWDAAKLQGCFGAAFTLEREQASTLPGPSEAPAARLFVLRRGA